VSRTPKGWMKTTLGAITDDWIDTSGPASDEEFVYIDIGSVDNETKRIVSPKMLRGSQAPSRAKQRVRSGDVLVSKTRPNLNAVALVDEDLDGAICSTGFHVLRPVLVEPHWLLFLVQSATFVESMSQLATGALYPAIKSKDIIAYEINLPPLNEQKRVVARIEELLSDLDVGVREARATLDKLPQHKEAVLRDAFTGELTRTWREQHAGTGETARKLIDRILQNRRTRWVEHQVDRFKAKKRAQGYTRAQITRWLAIERPKIEARYEEPEPPEVTNLRELVDGWLWASIDQLAVVVRGASPRPAGDPRFFGGNIPWITVGDLTADDSPYLRYVPATVTRAGKEASRFIEADTLVLTNSGATLGVPKITLIGGCINDGSVALLFVDNPLKLFLYYWLRTKTPELRAINQGAAQANLNTGIVRRIGVPLPPEEEQGKIIEEIERRLSAATISEQRARGAIAEAEKTREVVLREAFVGKLVPQDADDEPASVLLEEIRTGKARLEEERKQMRQLGHKQQETMKAQSKKSHVAIADVLRSARTPLTPKELFDRAGYAPEEVQDFYADLKQAVDCDRIIREERTEPTEPRLVLRTSTASVHSRGAQRREDRA